VVHEYWVHVHECAFCSPLRRSHCLGGRLLARTMRCYIYMTENGEARSTEEERGRPVRLEFSGQAARFLRRWYPQ